MQAPQTSQPTSALSLMQNFLLKGFEFDGFTGWLALAFITACPGIGQLGLNHVLVGQPIVALLKVISLPLSYFLMVLLSPYLPLWIQGQGIFVLCALGPWYLFDILQIFLGFNYGSWGYNTGYISMIDVPFIPLGGPGGKPGGIGGKWTLTASNMNILFAGLAGSVQLIPMIFGESTQAGANIASGIFGSLLGLSGIASIAATALANPLGAGVASGLTSGVTSVNPLLVGGGTLPTLSEFLDKLPPPQNGGGRAKERVESSFILNGLAFITLVGITLGILRSKQ